MPKKKTSYIKYNTLNDPYKVQTGSLDPVKKKKKTKKKKTKKAKK